MDKIYEYSEYNSCIAHFSPIRENEFPQYWKRIVNLGMGHMQEAGMMDTDITFQEAEQQLTKFVTNGIKAPGHYFMHTVKESNSIGSFWLQLMKRRSTEAYLWDIFIGEDRRGKGYVKNSTVEIEAFAKNKGATRIFLNVYSLNTVARNLYSKAGFRESAITMLKSL